MNTLTSCWEWNNAKDSWGYGHFFKDKKTVKAHRATYLEYYGKIPKGMYICHTCDNPACINPEHLWLGTPKENANDRDNKGRQIAFSGEDHPQSKLNWELVRYIRENPQKYTQKELSFVCGVALPTIRDVVQNRYWKEHTDQVTLDKHQK